MLNQVIDGMKRVVIAPQGTPRVVSLVPSDTYTICKMGCAERLVGRTDYCVEPEASVGDLPSVGGPKNVDVDAVLDLKPDLVIANQEENSRPHLEALAQAGARIYIGFPRTVSESLAHIATLAKLLGAAATPAVKELIRQGYGHLSKEAPPIAMQVFVPIWQSPLMTFSEDTYASDLLRLCGLENAFAKRERLHPLAADLGRRSPLGADQTKLLDTRYPRIVEKEIRERNTQCILLPNEPFEFKDEHREGFAKLAGLSIDRVHLVDGRDLFWHGARTVEALPCLREFIQKLAKPAQSL